MFNRKIKKRLEVLERKIERNDGHNIEIGVGRREGGYDLIRVEEIILLLLDYLRLDVKYNDGFTVTPRKKDK